MSPLLTPARRRGNEVLDSDVAPELRLRSHRDIALANRLFGGVRAVRAEVEPLLLEHRRDGNEELTLLDVGTGTGDIPARLLPLASRLGVRLRVVGVDDERELLTAPHRGPLLPVIANALALPLATRSVDIVICSQVLHHFVYDDALCLLRELDRVARRRVVIADLRRSWVAVAALWSVSYPLRFHPVSRHDGVVSILRGFTRAELQALVADAVGVEARVRNRPGFRLTAGWTPRPTRGGTR